PSDLPPDVVTVERARRATRAPIAVMGEVAGPQSVALLAAGADVVLPVNIREEELGARMLALVRRAAEGSDAGARYLVSGPLRIDLWQREATLDTEPLPLTGTEFRLLVCLMEADGQVVPSSRLISRVWGWAGAHDGLNTLRIGIARLRKKLGDDTRAPRFVISVRGAGYRFGGRVTELAAREEERREDRSGDLLRAERLARRCEELAEAPDARSAASQVVRSLIHEGTLDAVGLHLIEGDSLRLIAHHGFSAAWEQAARAAVGRLRFRGGADVRRRRTTSIAPFHREGEVRPHRRTRPCRVPRHVPLRPDAQWVGGRRGDGLSPPFLRTLRPA